MTSAQPRVPAGQTGGGRFASPGCPRMYALLDTLAVDPDAPVERSSYVSLGPAQRCPHGHFARWAARNCCAPRAARTAGADGSPHCTRPTSTGALCTRPTTRVLHGQPACHQHGGLPAATAA